MSRASLANANARMHAAKARLLTRAEAAPLFSATDDVAMQRVVAALGVAEPMRSVLRIYQTAIRGYPRGEPLFRALLERHEIEDVKMSWRRSRHGGITPLQIVEQLAGTPYAAIAATIARAHGTDIAAAELAFDRWVSQRLLDEARRLPRREVLARRLVESVARERDAELVRRGARWYGLTSVSGHAEDVVTLRRERRRLCRRAFIGSPFLLAPAVAVILLAEEEMRAVQALVERQGDASLDAPLLRALAASQIGA